MSHVCGYCFLLNMIPDILQVFVGFTIFGAIVKSNKLRSCVIFNLNTMLISLNAYHRKYM